MLDPDDRLSELEAKIGEFETRLTRLENNPSRQNDISPDVMARVREFVDKFAPTIHMPQANPNAQPQTVTQAAVAWPTPHDRAGTPIPPTKYPDAVEPKGPEASSWPNDPAIAPSDDAEFGAKP